LPATPTPAPDQPDQPDQPARPDQPDQPARPAAAPLPRLPPVSRVGWRVPRPRPPDAEAAFSADEIAAALAFARPRQRWGLASLAADLAVLALLALTGPGRSLVRAVAGLAGTWTPGRVALAVATAAVAQALTGLPFGLRSWRQDRRAGLATQGPRAWLADWGKARALGVGLTVLALGGLILAAGGLPGFPVTAAVGAALLVAVLTLAGPVLVEPLFNRFTPMAAGQVREEVLALAEAMGVPVAEVLVADASRRTRRVNAYVSGLGRTRRVVVYDTLTERAGPGELLLILAHELAHVRHRDVAAGTAGMAAVAGLGVLAVDRLLAGGPLPAAFAVGGLADPLAAPGVLLLAALGGLLAAPAASAISRWAEARADWAALEARRDPDQAVAVERRLALDNRSDLRPNRLLVAWFASHPPVMARIAQAWLWAERHGRPGPAAGGPDHPERPARPPARPDPPQGS
jgi:STE24 endopeptidase